MSAFGGRLDEPMLTDQIDDEYDVMNDETFGGEVPNDEWESEQVGEELDAAEAAVAAAETSLLEFAASRLPISEDPLDFLEQSISHLVDDDDVPFDRRQKPSTSMKPRADIFAPGSPQTPFFQLDKSNIWSDSSPLPSRPAPSVSTAGVSGLFERMRLNGGGGGGGGGDPFGLPTPEATPVLVKGAKTAEELEAEMLGKPIGTPSAAPQAQPKVPGPAVVKSCQELERELIESSRMANVAANAAPGQMIRPPTSEMQGMPGMPPGVGMPNMLMRPPPHPAMLANPQMRAALMARWLAANPGAVPPVWFRMPPPPMPMPPPGAPGFRPPITIRPGHNMPPVNFNNARMPQNVDPRAIGFMLQHGGMRRVSPNFPKRRLFDSPGRFGGGADGHYDRDRHRDRDRDRDYYHHNRDPFAGLMTRRERSWLIKIQTLQLHSENPYVDDYYWMMYRRRKMAAEGNANFKDTDHNDNFEHRVYVPPSFEGSLGKVQVLSANFPRQVLDLTASTAANGESKQAEEGSPRDSPPAVSKTGQIVPGRRLKNVLIEIENLYLVLLEANDLTMAREPDGEAGNPEETKEKALARAKNLVQTVLSTVIAEDRIANVLAVRKGRRLLVQLVLHCDKTDSLKLMQAILRNLLALSKKEPHQDILAVLKLIFDSKLTRLNEAEWSQLWEAISIDAIEIALKYKMGWALLAFLVQRSAVDDIKLDDGAIKVLERWASIAYTIVTNSNKDGQTRATGSMEKHQADQVSSWLKNVAGTSIPHPVIEALESSLVVETKS